MVPYKKKALSDGCVAGAFRSMALHCASAPMDLQQGVPTDLFLIVLSFLTAADATRYAARHNRQGDVDMADQRLWERWTGQR